MSVNGAPRATATATGITNLARTAVAGMVGWGVQAERVARRSAHDSTPPATAWRDEGTGDPLVLVNGFGASADLWPRAWVRDLEHRRRVIRVENRGTGHSTRSPFTIADLADDVARTLDACEVERATILGMSMGGMVAQEVAIRHPDRVRSLCLVSTIPPTPAHVPTVHGTRAVAAVGRTGSAHRDRAELFARLYLSAAGPAFHPAPSVLAELIEQLHARPTPLRGLVLQARAVVAWRGPDRLASIHSPTIVIAGREDAVVRLLNAQRLTALIPGARLVELDGVGHLVPWEAPGALSRLLDDQACTANPSHI
jgi:3-oxoadipate enol-lactonase